MLSFFKSTELKLCTDCKWCNLPEDGLSIQLWSKCLYPKAQQISHSLVDGRDITRYRLCWGMRSGKCGKKAKYFEDK